METSLLFHLLIMTELCDVGSLASHIASTIGQIQSSSSDVITATEFNLNATTSDTSQSPSQALDKVHVTSDSNADTGNTMSSTTPHQQTFSKSNSISGNNGTPPGLTTAETTSDSKIVTYTGFEKNGIPTSEQFTTSSHMGPSISYTEADSTGTLPSLYLTSFSFTTSSLIFGNEIINSTSSETTNTSDWSPSASVLDAVNNRITLSPTSHGGTITSNMSHKAFVTDTVGNEVSQSPSIVETAITYSLSQKSFVTDTVSNEISQSPSIVETAITSNLSQKAFVTDTVSNKISQSPSLVETAITSSFSQKAFLTDIVSNEKSQSLSILETTITSSLSQQAFATDTVSNEISQSPSILETTITSSLSQKAFATDAVSNEISPSPSIVETTITSNSIHKAFATDTVSNDISPNQSTIEAAITFASSPTASVTDIGFNIISFSPTSNNIVTTSYTMTTDFIETSETSVWNTMTSDTESNKRTSSRQTLAINPTHLAPATKAGNNGASSSMTTSSSNISNFGTYTGHNLTLANTEKSTLSIVTGRPTSSTTTGEIPVYIEEISQVDLPFSLTIENSLFSTVDLTNKTSDGYRHLTHTVIQDLTEVYQGTPGFQRIELTQLRKGSIIAEYTVVIEAHEVKTAIDHIRVNVASKLLNTTIARGTVNAEDLANELQKISLKELLTDLCLYLQRPACKFGYFCESRNSTSSVSCVTNCSLHPNLCSGHGYCFMDSRDDKLKCKCHEDGDFVYSGDHCDVITEKLALEKNYIIAIAAGSGGAVILIFIIIIAVIVWKRKASDQGKYIDDTHRSVSMDDLKLQKFENGSYSYQGYWSRTPTAGNMYESGLPEGRQARSHTGSHVYDSPLSDSRLVNGREHKVLKNDGGAETLIYQPSNLSRPLSAASSQHISSEVRSSKPSAYDYIDTDKKYEILRPRVSSTKSYLYDI